MGDRRVGPILFVLFVSPASNSQRFKKPRGKAPLKSLVVPTSGALNLP